MNKYSILFKNPDYILEKKEPSFFKDLNLDQVINSILKNREEFDLLPYFYTILSNIEEINFRQEIAKELTNEIFEMKSNIFSFEFDKIYHEYCELRTNSKETVTWVTRTLLVQFIDSYIKTINDFNLDLQAHEFKSVGLIGLKNFFDDYTNSEDFLMLKMELDKLRKILSKVKYSMLLDRGRIAIRGVDAPDDYYDDIITQVFKMIRTSDRNADESNTDAGSIAISTYDGEDDYNSKLIKALSKFQIEDVNAYFQEIPDDFISARVENEIMENLSNIFKYEFESLSAFYNRYKNFFNEEIVQIVKELQFYSSYNEFTNKISNLGLAFNYPNISEQKKGFYANDLFDIALAYNNLETNNRIIVNDFLLNEKERTIIISGPNQGGKTTYARAIGQMHYLAALGLKVPGSLSKLFLINSIFTHFEIEETVENMDGKLKQELIRVKHIFNNASNKSLLIINEIFSSTSLEDAIFIGKKLIDIVNKKDSLCLFVTFIEELSCYNETTVSMTSMVVPEMPDLRTYKLLRRKADGVTYALSIAQKHHVTYEEIKRRIKQ